MIKGLGTRRALAVVSVTVAASGVLARPAHAAATGTVKVSGTTVVFSAAPGATNAVTVSGITVDDRVPHQGRRRMQGRQGRQDQGDLYDQGRRHPDQGRPGDTCYVPPTGEHTMISWETVATNQPAALGLRSLDLAALSALLIR